MSKDGADIDLLGMGNDSSSVNTQPDSLLNESRQNILSGPAKLEKPFDGGNTLDEPVLTTIVDQK